ncbi:MAG: hypothetical protein JW982_04260 [Spirochaetes bacterium]|nr:hypothetical protein [Spirochaetota bacterium]
MKEKQMKVCRFIFLSSVMVFMLSCQVRENDTSNTIIHVSSGSTVYKSFKTWILTKSHNFSEDGKDTGFMYDNTGEPSLKATSFIYPGGLNLNDKDIQNHQNEIISAAVSNYDSYKIILSDYGTFSKNGNVYPSCFTVINFKKSEYSYTTIITLIYVKNWFVKNRITVLEEAFDRSSTDIQEFIQKTPIPLKEFY